MPNKHFYFAIGASNGVAIVYVIRKTRHWLYSRTDWMKRLYRWDRDWFLYFVPAIICFFGLFALTPDILHALRVLPKYVTREPVFNVFYFHSYFEWLEDHSPNLDWLLNTIGSVVLLAISIGIMIFYISLAKSIERAGVAEAERDIEYKVDGIHRASNS
jgi:hypothetical protein